MSPKSPASLGMAMDAESAEHSVERPVQEPPDRPLGPAGPDRIDDVVSFAVAGPERGDRLGRVLEVAVHDEHGLAPGLGQAGRDRDLVAEVPRQREPEEPPVGHVRLDDLGPRAVARAVVDEQDLGLDAHLVESLGEAADEDGEDLVLVEDAGPRPRGPGGLWRAGHAGRDWGGEGQVASGRAPMPTPRLSGFGRRATARSELPIGHGTTRPRACSAFDQAASRRLTGRRRDAHVVVGRPVAGRREPAAEEHRRDRPGEEEPDRLDLESSPFQHAAQPRGPVAAEVGVGLVVAAPEPGQGGDRQQQHAAGPREGEGRIEGRPVVLDVLQDVEHQQQVIRPVGTEARAEPADRDPVAPSGIVQQRGVGLEPVDLAEAGQRVEEEAVAAADVEDPARGRSRGRAGRSRRAAGPRGTATTSGRPRGLDSAGRTRLPCEGRPLRSGMRLRARGLPPPPVLVGGGTVAESGVGRQIPLRRSLLVPSPLVGEG